MGGVGVGGGSLLQLAKTKIEKKKQGYYNELKLIKNVFEKCT